MLSKQAVKTASLFVYMAESCHNPENKAVNIIQAVVVSKTKLLIFSYWSIRKRSILRYLHNYLHYVSTNSLSI